MIVGNLDRLPSSLDSRSVVSVLLEAARLNLLLQIRHGSTAEIARASKHWHRLARMHDAGGAS